MKKDSSYGETTQTNPVKFNKGIEENNLNLLKKFENSGSQMSNIDEDSTRMNFLCGPGVFDWSESRLMHDVKNNHQQFKVLSGDAYSEVQVYVDGNLVNDTTNHDFSNTIIDFIADDSDFCHSFNIVQLHIDYITMTSHCNVIMTMTLINHHSQSLSGVTPFYLLLL